MSAVNDYQIGQGQQLYVRALLDGDDQAAVQIIHQMVLARRPITDVYLNLITPALVEIGQLCVTEKLAWVWKNSPLILC